MIRQILPLMLAVSFTLVQPLTVTAQEIIRVSPKTTNQQPTTVKVWSGRATAIDFSATKQRIMALSRDTCKNLSYGHQSFSATSFQQFLLAMEWQSPRAVELTVDPPHNPQIALIVESGKG